MKTKYGCRSKFFVFFKKNFILDRHNLMFVLFAKKGEAFKRGFPGIGLLMRQPHFLNLRQRDKLV